MLRIHNELLLRVLCLVAGLVVCMSCSSWAGVITYTVQNPMVPENKKGNAVISVGIKSKVNALDANGKVIQLDQITGPTTEPIPLVSTDTANTKAAALVAQFIKQFPNFKPQPTAKDNQIIITGLPNDAGLFFSATGVPGEKQDSAAAKDDPTVAEIEFQGSFDELAPDDSLAAFTAGVSPDFGSKTFTLDASAFPNLLGATIADTLFADLAPYAAPLGILMGRLDFAPNDGKIIVNFPPGSASTGGGIVFGTSSFDGTVVGAIDTVVPEPSSLALLAGLVAAFAAARRASV
jgi:hypothetical protein